jgi:MFS family permease
VLAASAAAGLIVGQLAVCHGDFWRGIFILGLVPGILQGLVLWRTQPFLLVRWLALTQLGVVTTFVFSMFALLVVSSLLALLTSPASAAAPSAPAAPSIASGLAFFSGFFIGGAGLGGLQVTGFPRHDRRIRWVLATMLGSVSVAPTAFVLVGLGSCEAYGVPNQVLGLIGGSLYGIVTAIALPPQREP